MRTFYNDPENYVNEMVEGIMATHPKMLKQVGNEKRAIMRFDAPVENKVTILTGGGSGHLPVFMGYVGKGLLDGAAIGSVFASPSVNQMLTLTKAAHGGRGVLYLYGNYGGDAMNFDMAAEMAQEEGVKVRTVLVADDVASSPKGKEKDRRGVAGLFYAYKVAGACADSGASLEEVSDATSEALSFIRSLGVAISPCTVPGTTQATFTIGPSEMEIGMGIHGEAGIMRAERRPADAVVDDVIGIIWKDMPLEKGDQVSVLVNSLGATPLEELYILYRRVSDVLKKERIEIYKPYVGRYATSLEMAGFSITIFKLNKKFKGYLDHPVWTPFVREG